MREAQAKVANHQIARRFCGQRDHNGRGRNARCDVGVGSVAAEFSQNGGVLVGVQAGGQNLKSGAVGADFELVRVVRGGLRHLAGGFCNFHNVYYITIRIFSQENRGGLLSFSMFSTMVRVRIKRLDDFPFAGLCASMDRSTFLT